MHKTILALLLGLSSTSYAFVSCDTTIPDVSVYQKMTRTVSNHYSYHITNSTPYYQTYTVQTELYPVDLNTRIDTQVVSLSPGQQVDRSYDFSIDVLYMNIVGNRYLDARISIQGVETCNMYRRGLVHIRG